MRISDWSSDVCSSDLGACESDRRSNPCSSPENAKRAPVPGWVPGEPGVTGDAGPAAEAAGGISKYRCVRRLTRINPSTTDDRTFGQLDLYVHNQVGRASCRKRVCK